MDRIRLGIIGCGNMAGAHAEGFAYLQDVLTVTATADILLERAQQAALATGAKTAVTDYRELLDEVDAVLVALPHDLHHPVGVECLRAGKHVLMEKPLCNTEAECLELMAVAEAENRVLMTAYPVRYNPIMRKMKEMVDDGVCGDLFQLSIFTEQLTRYEPGHWSRSAQRLGGGQFFSHGCHYVDIMLWMLGRPISGVHMGTNYGTPWMEREGTSNMVMNFESGAVGYHFGTWGARGSRHGYNMQAFGTKGMIEYDRTAGKLYFHKEMELHTASITESKVELIMETVPGRKNTHYEIRHFAECVLNGRKPETDGYDSLQGLRVIWSMYEAERAGTIADLRGLGLRVSS